MLNVFKKYNNSQLSSPTLVHFSWVATTFFFSFWSYTSDKFEPKEETYSILQQLVDCWVLGLNEKYWIHQTYLLAPMCDYVLKKNKYTEQTGRKSMICMGWWILGSHPPAPLTQSFADFRAFPSTQLDHWKILVNLNLTFELKIFCCANANIIGLWYYVVETLF